MRTKKQHVIGNIIDSFRTFQQFVREPVNAPVSVGPGESRLIEGVQLVRFGGDSTPRVLDMDLAQRAGLAAPRNVRNLIDSHREELEEFGEIYVCTQQMRTSMPRGGERETEVNTYWLNEAQAYHLVALMRTPKAAELRVLMTKVFMAWAHGELQGNVSALATRIAKLESAQQDVTTIVRREVEPLRKEIDNHALMSASMQHVIKIEIGRAHV